MSSSRLGRSLVILSFFPWCFSFLDVFLAAKFVGLFECFLLVFPGFLRVRKVRKILGVFEVFLGIFEKTKEKKDREKVRMTRRSA